MPTLSAQVTFSNYPCILPGRLYEDAVSVGVFVDTQFLDRANCFGWTIGQNPGRGYFLLTAGQLQGIDFSAPQLIEFRFGDSVVAMPGLLIVKAVKVGGILNDPNAAYCVEVTDRRWLCRRSAFTLSEDPTKSMDQFNVDAPERNKGYIRTLDLDAGGEHVPYTWERFVSTIWNNIPALGPWPGFPPLNDPPESPPHKFRWPGENPYAALGAVLETMMLTLVYDPVADTFTLAALGDPVAVAEVNQLLEANSPFLYDAQPVESIITRFPEKVRVNFHSRNWDYGQDVTIPTTQDSWQTQPVKAIELPSDPAGVSGVVDILWDDLPAVYNTQGSLLNDDELQARAAVRLDNYLTELRLGRFKRVFTGNCNGTFKVNGALPAMAFHEFRDGLKTTVIRVPHNELPDDDSWWLRPLRCEQESLAPPDIARPQIPFQRFAWVRFIDDLQAGKCARAIVLKAFEQRDSQGGCLPVDSDDGLVKVTWQPCQTDQGPLIIEVNEVTGKQSVGSGNVAMVWWHWQANRWTLITTIAEERWPVRIIDRCDRAYSWFEVEPIPDHWPIVEWQQCQDPTLFRPKQGGRSGIKDLFDINGGAPNVHGGSQPLVTYIWRGHEGIPSGGGCTPPPSVRPYYLCDLGMTNECDGERFLFVP